MEIERKKNEATEICFAAVDSASPASLKTGVSPVDTAYYKDGGAWTSLAISDTATEIGTTGMYQISMAQAEMNHDLIAIKFAVANMADTMLIIRTRAVDLDDLVRATVPANTLDVSAGGEAGIDWANVGGQGTAVDLSATAIDLCDEVTLCDGVTLVDGVTLCDQTSLVDSVTLCDQTTIVDDVTTLNTAFTDASNPTANGLIERIRRLCWLLQNKMTVVNASGNTVVYKDDGTTPAFTVASALTDDDTDTVRLRLS